MDKTDHIAVILSLLICIYSFYELSNTSFDKNPLHFIMLISTLMYYFSQMIMNILHKEFNSRMFMCMAVYMNMYLLIKDANSSIKIILIICYFLIHYFNLKTICYSPIIFIIGFIIGLKFSNNSVFTSLINAITLYLFKIYYFDKKSKQPFLMGTFVIVGQKIRYLLMLLFMVMLSIFTCLIYFMPRILLRRVIYNIGNNKINDYVILQSYNYYMIITMIKMPFIVLNKSGILFDKKEFVTFVGINLLFLVFQCIYNPPSKYYDACPLLLVTVFSFIMLIIGCYMKQLITYLPNLGVSVDEHTTVNIWLVKYRRHYIF